MRNAFTLVELLFVIVLMGVLAGIGYYYSRPDYTRLDAQYTLLKLKEARYHAIGYETVGGSCSDSGWVQLSKSSLQSDGHAAKHPFKSTIEPEGMVICFDALGRPHDGNHTTDAALSVPMDINFTTPNGKKSTIRLYPQTGYAIISCN